MEENNKQLLIRDICARLPYGVYVKFKQYNEPLCLSVKDALAIYNGGEIINDVQYLYLRHMSSMTEDEINEFILISDTVLCLGDKRSTCILSLEQMDWLNKKMFDFRGLIEKGLALESPEGMYKEEESEKESEIPIPKTIDEAISTLEKILSEEDREYLLENGAISMHDSLGRWIRNEWGLWTDSELKNELKKKGFEHPDDMSNYIIEEFINYWNNKS